MTITINETTISANESTLNLIAIYATEAAEAYERDGLRGLAQQADLITCEIHAALNEVDYYLF